MSEEPFETPEMNEAYALIIQLFEERLDSAGVARLDQLICADADARKLYIRLSHQYCAIRPLIAGIIAENEAAKSGNRAEDEWPDPIVLPETVRFAPPQPARRGLRIAFGILATAAVIMIAVGVQFWMRPAPSYAKLVAELDCKWDMKLQQGASLPVTPLKLIEGLAKVQTSDGTVVILEAPAIFTISKPGEINLNYGSATATVPPNAHGFAIATPSARIVDLGTEFGVNVNRDNATLIEVFRGKVTAATDFGSSSATTAPSQPAQPLVAGEAAKVEPNSNAIVSVPSNPTAFARNQEFDNRVAELKLSPGSRWRTASYLLRRDPSVVAYYTFDKQTQSPSSIANDARTGSGFDATIGSGEGKLPTRVAGRWPDKVAVKFDSDFLQYLMIPPSPALDFASPSPRPFSISVWINPDLTQPESAKLAGTDAAIFSRGRAPRAQYGMGLSEGHFGGWIRQQWDPSTNNSNTVNVVGPKFTPGWHNLVFVVDPPAGVMMLYVDGTLGGSTRIANELLPSDGGPAMVGARLGSAVPYRPGFNGLMDEFVIYSRALEPHEIRDMYQSSKPQ